MIEIKSSLKYYQEAPRKIRLVANLIKKNINVTDAKSQLNFLPQRAAKTLLSVLNSAVANAKHNYNLEEEDLIIKEIIINEGPKLKRWRSVAMGSAHPIEKKTSHIIIKLEGDLSKKSKSKPKLDKKEKNQQEKVKDKDLEKEEKTQKIKEKSELKKKTAFWEKQNERVSRRKSPKRRFFQRKSI